MVALMRPAYQEGAGDSGEYHANHSSQYHTITDDDENDS
jgi:hypothetical protein